MQDTMSPCRYDLNTLEGHDMTSLYSDNQANIDALLNTLNLKQKRWVVGGKNYNVIRYDKQFLTKDRMETVGMFRSVVHTNGKVVSFAPPKTIPYDTFMSRLDSTKPLKVEDYIEGTMINVFHDGDSWEITTRSSVGGSVAFYTMDGTPQSKIENTFRWMFFDAIKHSEIMYEGEDANRDFFVALDRFPKNYTFSFVLQHPKNRIVVPFTTPKLFLVKVYEITKNVVTEIDINPDLCRKLPTWLMYPMKLSNDLDTMAAYLSSGHADYKIVGTMLTGYDNNGVLMRSKYRNVSYEIVRNLRGNQPKLQYRYLMLRQGQKVKDYLRYYPEHKSLFGDYRDLVHKFTHELHSRYISCYVNKEGPLGGYSPQYRTHMYKLHELYTGTLSKENKIVTRNVAVNYVNNLHPSLLMHSINYHHRQAKEEMELVQDCDEH
jgi:hypothetical protein